MLTFLHSMWYYAGKIAGNKVRNAIVVALVAVPVVLLFL